MSRNLFVPALVLVAGLAAAPAFAQSYTAPAGIPAETTVAAGATLRGEQPAFAPRADEGLATGSVARARHGVHGSRR